MGENWVAAMKFEISGFYSSEAFFKLGGLVKVLPFDTGPLSTALIKITDRSCNVFCKYDCKLLIFRSSGNQNYQSFRGANGVKRFQGGGGEGSPRGRAVDPPAPRWLRGWSQPRTLPPVNFNPLHNCYGITIFCLVGITIFCTGIAISSFFGIIIFCLTGLLFLHTNSKLRTWRVAFFMIKQLEAFSLISH